jgi:hypothetical protein
MGRKGKKEMLGGFFCFIGEEGGGGMRRKITGAGEKGIRDRWAGGSFIEIQESD